jgi:hypothetical protein
MIAEALRHFLECPNADWEAGDHRPAHGGLSPGIPEQKGRDPNGWRADKPDCVAGPRPDRMLGCIAD